NWECFGKKSGAGIGDFDCNSFFANNLNLMLEEIFILGQATTRLEIVAMLTGILGVWLTMKKSIWCFPVGIVNVSLYAWLFFSPGIRLYADSFLQCVYILLLIYGWLNWAGALSKTHERTFKISLPSSKKMIVLSLIGTLI